MVKTPRPKKREPLVFDKSKTKSTKFDIALPYLGTKERKQFAENVLSPLRAAGVEITAANVQLKAWESIYAVMRLKMSVTGYRELPPLKKLQNYHNKLDKLLKEITAEKSLLHDYFINIQNELILLTYNLRQLIQVKKEKPTVNHRYPKGIQQIAKSLVVYWNDHTKGKYKITGHGYLDDEIPGQKKFDMKRNPGEYYLQQSLKNFFGYPYSNAQIKTLVGLIKKLPNNHARSMTQADYDWWENDPIWSKKKK